MPLSRIPTEQPPRRTAHKCILCGVFHDLFDHCPTDLLDSDILAADLADQARHERREGQR